VYEFKATVPDECKLLEAYSVSHGKASPWLPVIELLRAYFGLRDTDDAAMRREKVRASLAALESTLSDTPPYLWNLLSIQEVPDPFAQMDGQIKRQRTLEAFKRIILRESLKQPVMIIFEDLHWIDSETQALLDLMADSIANARVLMLVNYRPEYCHEWGNKSYYSQLRLEPLDNVAASEMLTTLLGDNPELDPLKRLIIERTEGNPFFIEEMLQALFDEGVLARNGVVKITRPFSQLRLPATVQGILAARIDRQPAEHKQLLQTLAVIGRESRLDLLRHIVPTTEPQLHRMLSELQASEFIYEQPAFRQAEYVFKHALTQEVAYNSVLIEWRKALHERVGIAMEAMYADHLDDHLDKLAHHFGRSDDTGKAIDYYGRAGKQAQRRGAYPIAITYFNQALELLTKIPQNNKRDSVELNFRLSVAANLIAVKSLGAPEVLENYSRACELCRGQSDTLRVLPALFGLCWYYLGKGQLDAACELGNQMVALAAGTPSPLAWLWADTALGPSLMWSGEFALARTRLEHGFALYETKWVNQVITDFGVLCLSFLALALWQLGFTEQAIKRADESLALARRLNHVHSIGHALISGAIVNWFRRDMQQLQEYADNAITFAAKHELSYWLPMGRLLRGVVASEQGGAEQAVLEINRALSAYQATGSKLALPMLFSSLVESYKKTGRTQEALAVLRDALAAISTGRFYASELHRQWGELLLMQNPSDSKNSEQSFRAAIEIAQHQNAKAWELRATMSLARLLCDTGRRDEARTTLAEIYNWFTEGFDTADLKEAKALLDELSE
jgi:tetratricopeptide (TPR) repeat protein